MVDQETAQRVLLVLLSRNDGFKYREVTEVISVRVIRGQHFLLLCLI